MLWLQKSRYSCTAGDCLPSKCLVLGSIRLLFWQAGGRLARQIASYRATYLSSLFCQAFSFLDLYFSFCFSRQRLLLAACKLCFQSCNAAKIPRLQLQHMSWITVVLHSDGYWQVNAQLPAHKLTATCLSLHGCLSSSCMRGLKLSNLECCLLKFR